MRIYAAGDQVDFICNISKEKSTDLYQRFSNEL